MIERVPISRMGHDRLKKELENLERRERHDVIRAIEVAREHGDLKENAEYHAAKERQGHVEGRILELKDKLSRAEVIDCSDVNCSRAVFGTVVTMMDLDEDVEVTYQLLGPEESNVEKGVISIQAPLGRSILGKEVGDDVKVVTPGGIREFEILDIKPPEND
ncbi:MAG: transcription elongation factor GreA [Desulfobacterales bacterium]|jgi:transcription elongation factor GreA|nr:transcription elongation factor GreA [Desulfobulbaceae bacterium]MDX2434071.1 transcription elongation factor GreA [Desulfobacterales bacterium]